MAKKFKFKGTQGKWEVNFNNFKNIKSISPPINCHEIKGIEYYVCLVYGDTYDLEAKANALLISKAPEMLKMLKKCKDALLELQEYQDGWEQDYEDLKQLLKEATTL